MQLGFREGYRALQIQLYHPSPTATHFRTVSAEVIQSDPLIVGLANQLLSLDRNVEKITDERLAASGFAAPPRSATVEINTAEPERSLLDVAQNRYAERRRRVEIFGDAGLFGEPGWDILLDLYIAHATERSVSVSSACIGSASPPTTGLRWLISLEEAGLVSRERDPKDQRRILVRLSEDGIDSMESFLREISGKSVPLRRSPSKRRKRTQSRKTFSR